MHDIKDIRANPDAFTAALARRKLPGTITHDILRLDHARRAGQTELQELQNKRNEKSKLIGQMKAKGEDAQGIMAEVAAMKDEMAQIEAQEKDTTEELNNLLAGIPNILADDVPDGADESQNKEIRRVGEPKNKNSQGRDHVYIGEALGMMDFESAAKISGSRFVILSGGLARLERALAQFMLDTHTNQHGYTEVSPPLLVKSDAMYGTGQLPKFADDLFQTSKNAAVVNRPNEIDPTGGILKYATVAPKEKMFLIPTSEVPLTNIVHDEIVDEKTLPRRYTAHTPCFRSEAGAAGKDTKGMIRQHQFYKVEMVSITKADESEAEHERMTKCAETILEKLGLSFRTIVLCSGDTGFGARKTYDIEVWLPGQNTYREISSCSNCWDFQARRMKARYKPEGSKETVFVHTLNGSGVAVGRALIAVLENYWDEADQSVAIPDVLKPYMGGIEKLKKA